MPRRVAKLEAVGAGNKPPLKSAQSNIHCKDPGKGKGSDKGKHNHANTAKGAAKGKLKGIAKETYMCKAKAGAMKKPAAASVFGCSKRRWKGKGRSACRN